MAHRTFRKRTARAARSVSRFLQHLFPSARAGARSKTVSIRRHSATPAIPVLIAATISGTQYVKADIYYEPGINPYREQASQDSVESIDPYTGMLKVRHLDFVLRGNGGLDIKLIRTYDSASVASLGVGGGLLSPMGNGWAFHFGLFRGYNVCNPNSSSGSIRPTLELADGTQFRFYKAPTDFGHLYTSKEGWVADCASNGEGLLAISPEGLRYELTVKGVNGFVIGANVFYVKRITDKHANWLNFDYQVTNNTSYVLKVTASDGRVIDFSYDPGVTTGTRLSKVTANGKSWLYSYALSGTPISPTTNTSNFELAKVTRPDGKSWRYEYPTFPSNSPFVTARGFLGAIIYPDGGEKKYTYSYVSLGVSLAVQMLRVTQQTVSDNVTPEAVWKYRYKFWQSVAGSSIGVSITDVTDPAGGLTTYKHETPYNATGVSAWRVGLLLDKLECSSNGGTVLTCDPLTSENREQLDWASQLISPDPYEASTGIETYFDTQTHRPVLERKTITRDGTPYVTQYQFYDVYGNPGRTVETGNGATRTTDLTYYNDPVKWITGLKDKETIDGAWIIDRTFDGNGNMLSISKYGVSTAFTYHPSGDLASITDARQNRTDYSDYFRGVPRREDQPDGVTVLRAVNATGTVASETDGEGRQTQYTYDELNRLSKVVPPIGNPSIIQRDTNGSVCVDRGYGCEWLPIPSKRVTRGNFEESTLFDGFGRETDVTKRDQSTSIFVRRAYRYDALGRKLIEAYPTTSSNAIVNTLGQVSLPSVQYSYDPLGRLTKITHADGKPRQLQYLAGNQVKVTNENAKVTTYTYRSFGDPDQRELTSVTAPVAAANMVITRNALGQITGMAQGDVSRTMQYDSRGYLVKTYHPEIGWVTYGRDAVGNPVSKSVGVAPGVRTVNYVYDNRNRLTASTYQDATTPAVTLSYNRVDDVVGASRGGISRIYAYDANRNLTDEALHVDGRAFGLRYDYDGNDAVSHVTYPDGQVVGFRPDALGRPTEVSPYVSAIGYHPSGQVSSMAYANGVSTTQAFNARLWPQQMSVIAPAGTLLNTAYGYDGLGNVTSMVDGIDASYNRTLSYDAIDRLIGATGPWGAGSITYDGRGNLLSQNYGTGYSRTYAYDTSNRLASYTGSSAFTYDAWGNATRSGNALSYQLFDDASNLYCAVCDSAAPLRFEYDANNYRVKKTRNGVVTYALYAKDGNLMMEYTPSAGDLKQFAYHNKKQVAMRHVVDPAMTLGQNGMLNPSRFAAAAIPLKPAEIETGVLSGLIPSTPLLSLALTASAD